MPKHIPASPADWSRAAMGDIEAAYRETFANHPGVCDPANPGFLSALQAARQRGLALAARVADAAGYRAAIQTFSAGMHDAHAGANVQMDPALFPAPRWPGFITVWRGDSLRVYATQNPDIPVGATIMSADRVPIRALIQANVYGFHGMESAPGDWWVRAGTVLLDSGNPFIQIPRSCLFSCNGRVWNHQLHWKQFDADAKNWLRESINGDAKPPGMDEPAPGLVWISLPTFQPDATTRGIYREIFARICNEIDRIAKARAIVIDLRHNSGGSSDWAYQLATALFGKAAVDRRLLNQTGNTEIWWRASVENTAHVTGLVEQLRSQRLNHLVDWAEKTAECMQTALRAGQNFYIERGTPVQDGGPDDPALFSAPIYIIVPGQCGSACLDAIDFFKLFPRTRLIGAPSSSDSTYMDVRTKILPSGMAFVIIPNKLYVNRPRLAGQFYPPDIINTNLHWSSAKFLEMIQADLAT